MNHKLLIIIPARGNSKGILRKNIRAMSGKPLLYYSVRNAKALAIKDKDIYVDSEDSEILFIGREVGAKIIKRDKELSEDHVTLDQVIMSSLRTIEKNENKKYDFIMVLQATCPLLKPETLHEALNFIVKNQNYDSIVSATRFHGIVWKVSDKGIEPLFSERNNRQYMREFFLKENGAFTITKREAMVTEKTRFTKKIKLYEISTEEGLDIDTSLEWDVSTSILKRKKILFNVVGNERVGTGHLNRILALYDHLTYAHKQVVCLRGNDLAHRFFSTYNIPTLQFESIEDLISLAEGYDLVINDILDTSSEYILKLRGIGKHIVNFEDLGTGALFADAVINELYRPPGVIAKVNNIYWGHQYYCARTQFLCGSKKIINRDVKRILILIGGRDLANLTKKIVDAVYEYCVNNNIEVKIIVGMAYKKLASLKEYKKVFITSQARNMAEEILDSDIVFTSFGRTLYETTIIGVPTIAIIRNRTERKHPFIDFTKGIRKIGFEPDIEKNDILKAFIELVGNYDARKKMNKAMLDKKKELEKGIEDVIKILSTIS